MLACNRFIYVILFVFVFNPFARATEPSVLDVIIDGDSIFNDDFASHHSCDYCHSGHGAFGMNSSLLNKHIERYNKYLDSSKTRQIVNKTNQYKSLNKKRCPRSLENKK